MAPALKKDSRILIIGGGTFGTSTAYHLARRGYNSVTVLDRLPPPSEIAAGNDINKVIRADYPDSLYANLACESIQVWRDPDSLFRRLYHRCGWLLAAPQKGSSLDFIRGSAKVAAEKGFEPAKQVSAGEVRQRWSAYCGAMVGWQIFWNSSAGWANARLALQRMAEAAKAMGVGYIVGDSGFVTNILYDESGHAIGAESADGTFHKADLVLVAAGAAAASILNFEGQLVAKGHTVGHIQFTPSEIEKYKSLPIVDHFEGGIIFPPQEDGIIKIGAVHFVTNYDPASHPNISLPRYRCDHKADGIPKPIESHLRSWLRQLAPELADRPWFETRVCWDADTPDFHFLISPHPKHGGLHMAVGGSAHGFKFMPVIGNYVVDSLEGRLDADTARKWRWRPNAPATPNPHPASLLDLNALSEWRRSKAKL
ncbi:putative sarcosine oxidase [Teratosphaeria destructans]|uniref:Sarcosine oxidase n=1 Tax=Teratosphaeria destructans TaxID=418781 RepID=A0A9W7SKV8_9PEZI|nr:putative sarcosine oxidase [Teratosphaeria destructans]